MLRMEQLAEIWNPHRRPRAAKRNLDRRRAFYSALGRKAHRPLSRAF